MGAVTGSLDRLASRQAGLLTTAQCVAGGMSPAAAEWRVTSKRWARPYPGVYLTTPGRDDFMVRVHAALLAALSGRGPADAALRAETAGHLWGLEREPRGPVQLMVPQRRSVRLGPRVDVLRSMRWNDVVDDMAYPWRTTPAATVIEISSRRGELDALSLVARAVQRGLVSPSQVVTEIDARGGHRHSRLLRSALDEVEDGAESGIEVAYVRDVERAHGLPHSTAQVASVMGGGRRHDRGYDAQRVMVEIDGRFGHEQWSDRVRDGRRDRVSQGAARVTTRVFFSDVVVTPCRTAAEVGQILRVNGWQGRPRPCRRRTCTADAGV